VNDTDVYVLHPGSKPKLDINCKLVPLNLIGWMEYWSRINNDVDPGGTCGTWWNHVHLTGTEQNVVLFWSSEESKSCRSSV